MKGYILPLQVIAILNLGQLKRELELKVNLGLEVNMNPDVYPQKAGGGKFYESKIHSPCQRIESCKMCSPPKHDNYLTDSGLDLNLSTLQYLQNER